MGPSSLGRTGTSPLSTSNRDGSGSGSGSHIEVLHDRPHNVPLAAQDMVKRGQNAQGLTSGGMVSARYFYHPPKQPGVSPSQPS
jgi:hypothetical protein